MASVSDDAIHEVMQGLRPTSATPRVDWQGDHACGCSGKIVEEKEMQKSESGDRKSTERLGAYMLYFV